MGGFFFAWAMWLLLPHPARAQSVVATVPAGTGPRAIAVNPVTNRVYVANEFSNDVTVIDGATLAVTTLPTGGTGRILVDETINRICVIRMGVADEVTYVKGNDHTSDVRA